MTDQIADLDEQVADRAYLDEMLPNDPAAKFIGLAPRTLQNRRRAGEGPPYYDHGGRVRNRGEDLIKFGAVCKRRWFTQACAVADGTYAGKTSAFRRRSCGCPTVNKVAVLADDTGNRRYLPLSVEKVPTFDAAEVDSYWRKRGICTPRGSNGGRPIRSSHSWTSASRDSSQTPRWRI